MDFHLLCYFFVPSQLSQPFQKNVLINLDLQVEKSVFLICEHHEETAADSES